jgi:hypothetical protein
MFASIRSSSYQPFCSCLVLVANRRYFVRMNKEWRPDRSPATLGDLREVYRKLKEVDARVTQMQAEMFMLHGAIVRDRELFGELRHNMTVIAQSFHGMPSVQEFRQLLKALSEHRPCRDRARPSRIRRRRS